MGQRGLYTDRVLEAYDTLARFIVYGAKGQPPLWPFSIIETNWYYTHFFPREIYHTISALQNRGVSNKKISELCWGPSAVSHWFYIVEPAFGVPALNPFSGLSKQEGIDFIEKTVDILSIQRQGDAFCRDGKNIILSESEVNKTLEDKEFLDSLNNPDITRSIRSLTMTLWHYAILIQGGHRAYSHEFHGPYPLDSRRLLLIKDFHWLRPGEGDKLVWDFSSGMPYDEISVLEIYENAEIQIDMCNHYRVSGDLVKFCVHAKGSSLSDEKVRDLSKVCQAVLYEGNRTIRDYQKSDWIRKIIDLRYLWLKPHKDILGKDWRPSDDIYDLANRVNEAEMASEQFEKKMISLVRGLSPEEIVKKVAQILVDIIYE